MSFLNLNNNISRLRKEKRITQEALAEFAGVTKASVSKWETGATTPDIQILPILAAFFDVSVDELLGYEAQLSSKQIRYYYHKLAQEFAQKDFEEVWEESRELVKKYYGCYAFLMQMAILWLNHASLAKTEEQKAEILSDTEKICTRIIEGSGDNGLCENAVAIRSIVWLQQGRANPIIESMEKEVMDSNRPGDKGALLTMAYLSVGNASMAEKSSQIGIYRHLMELVTSSMYLLMSTQREETYCKEIMNRTDQILEAFQVGKLNPNVAAVYQYQVALKLCSNLALKSDQEKPEERADLENEIYERIEKYVQMIVQVYEDGIKLHSDAFFFQLEDWFEKLDLGPEGVRDGKVILEDSIASLNHPSFALLQDKNRMKKCERRLQRLSV